MATAAQKKAQKEFANTIARAKQIREDAGFSEKTVVQKRYKMSWAEAQRRARGAGVNGVSRKAGAKKKKKK